MDVIADKLKDVQELFPSNCSMHLNQEDTNGSMNYFHESPQGSSSNERSLLPGTSFEG